MIVYCIVIEDFAGVLMALRKHIEKFSNLGKTQLLLIDHIMTFLLILAARLFILVPRALTSSKANIFPLFFELLIFVWPMESPTITHREMKPGCQHKERRLSSASISGP